ncbi:ferrous iron transporter B [Trichothermofontia sichuanensis B231]|uniref:ferrous iron transporter B n=1 Tax=Trichothermofontia sichuanensis TaxID=3045816 RepID=UPI0022479881|nr:ferrous iron transporter B [Trichothermofontia sichuanensis]UZQ56159.1 ferrous iron transporter B [Trichothermofontia sichuanensis B231]
MSQPVVYPRPIETAITQIERILAEANVRSRSLSLEESSSVFSREASLDVQLTLRSLALLLLQKDPVLAAELQLDSQQQQQISAIIAATQAQLEQPLSLAIAQSRQQLAWELESATLSAPSQNTVPLAERLHQITVNPLTGFPLLLLILYFGVYQFVGQFGAGTLVDLIETFFENRITPVVNHGVSLLIPWPVVQDLIANDYGIITLGIRYAIAIVLPVVATYFLVFSLLEDSGYLPRLSLMLDRLFSLIGLSGRAVIPIVLGLGCDTMATMVTRTLETRRERIIAIFLLSLAVPCAAQWGLILGLLAQKPVALLLWASIISSIFMTMGYLVSRLLPGQKASFYMEVPPLRLPKLSNVLTKTYVRMKWYFWEIIPLFIWASVIIWVGRLTGVFDLLVRGLEPVMGWLGLPGTAAPVFIYGFFRRDYGAAGLFDLQQNGVLTGSQLLVAAIVLTLFLPCVAQLQIMLKEQGAKLTIAMVAFIIPFAFLVGYLVNSGLHRLALSV